MWLLFAAATVRLILLFDPFRSMRRHWSVLTAAAALGATAANAVAIYGNARAGRWLGELLGSVPADPGPTARRPSSPHCSRRSPRRSAWRWYWRLSAPVLNRIAHALMIGMFTGFGFLMAENLNLTTISGLNDTHSYGHGIEQSMTYRLPTIVSSHWCYTGLTAVALLLLMPWFAERANWSRRRRLGTASALVIAALLMHGLWNLPQPGWLGLAVANAAKIAVNTAILLTATLLLLRVERRRVLSDCPPSAASRSPASIRRFSTHCRRTGNAAPYASDVCAKAVCPQWIRFAVSSAGRWTPSRPAPITCPARCRAPAPNA